MQSLYESVNEVFLDTCAEFGIAYAKDKESAEQGQLYLSGDGDKGDSEVFCIMEMGEAGGRELSAWQFTDDMIEALEMSRVLNQRRLDKEDDQE